MISVLSAVTLSLTQIVARITLDPDLGNSLARLARTPSKCSHVSIGVCHCSSLMGSRMAKRRIDGVHIGVSYFEKSGKPLMTAGFSI